MAGVIDLTTDTPPPRRQTRSSTRSQTAKLTQPSTSTSTSTSPSSPPQLPPSNFSALPWVLRNPPSLNDPLQRKRNWLQNYSVTLPEDLQRRNLDANPAAATLVFAQEEAGTAVCISPDGVILTCAHCVAETAAELDLSALHTLLFASGSVVSARTVAWDPVRDLALLIVAEAEDQRPFPFMRFASSAPKKGARLLCIGHPGSEDLEATVPGLQTGYDTLVLSTGTFRGIAAGQDPQNNRDIGALAHTCWTYWGHSGAGLVDRRTGALVGLHSSWDDETGMRRGVPWEAVEDFVGEFERKQEIGKGVPEGWRWCM
ncbi:trypsin-like cysteine/serine peptidase domain-containing protein, partial [Ilyonectria destructans]